MLRRRFLGLLAAAAAVATDSLSILHDEIGRAGRALPATVLAYPRRVYAPSEGFALTDLLARKTVPLGQLNGRRFYVSLDDIEAHRFPTSIVRGRNAFVISAFEENGASVSSALARAVLKQLRVASPSDYREVSGGLRAKTSLEPGRVLSFRLNIPPGNRHLLPVDDLLAVVQETGPSGGEGFAWVGPVFEVARQRQTSNLVVPCLGRHWQDRHSIQFEDFFPAFLSRVPRGLRPRRVYMSLYAQWPSFELEAASAALNAAWKRSSG
jgi:hypothetical protein